MSKEPSLFPDPPQPDTAVQPTPSRDGAPRVLVPERNQIELRPVDLDATLAPEHPARAVGSAGGIERLTDSRDA